MTGAEYLQRTAERMAADGSQVSSVGLRGGNVLVGYQSQFRVRWAFTKLHLFSGAVAVPVATPEILASFTSDLIEYAKATKGQFRGLQTGVAIIPALVVDQVTPEARAAAQRRPGRKFAAMSFPVIVDLSAGLCYSYHGQVLLGGFYAGWVRARSVAVFPPSR